MSNNSVSPEKLLSGLAIDAGVITFGGAVGKLLLQVYYLLLARILGPAAFGIYFLAYTMMFTGVGLISGINNNAIMRFAAVYHEECDSVRLRALTTFAYLVVIVLGTLGGVFLILNTYWVASVLFRKPELTRSLPYLALTLPLLGVLRLSTTTLIVIRRPIVKVIASDVLLPVLLMASLAILVWTDVDRLSLVSFSYTIGTGVCALIVSWYLWRANALLGDIRSLSLRETIVYSGVVYVMANMATLIRWSDVLLIGYFLDAQTAGLYVAAVQISLVINLLILSFDSVFGPTSAALFAKKQTDTLYRAYIMSTKWSVIIALPLLILAIAVGDGILALFYGDVYSSAYIALIILTLGQVVVAATTGAKSILLTTDYERRELGIVILTAIATIFLNAPSIFFLGLNGAAFGKMASLSLVQGLRTSVLGKIFDQRVLTNRFFKPVASSVISVMTALLFRFAFSVDVVYPLGLGIVSLVALMVYAIALQLFGWDNEDRLLLSHFYRRIPISLRRVLKAKIKRRV